MTLSLAALSRQYLDLYPAGHILSLDFDGYAIQVRSNSKKLIGKLSRYFRDFVSSIQKPDITIHALEAPAPDPETLDLKFTTKLPDPGKSKVKEEFSDLEDGRIIRKRLTGMLFLFGQDTHIALGPCVENDNQVINFINNRFIAWELDKGSLLFHAAGVARHGKGLALAGFSGMGKSTLALHIMSYGTDFVSNDRLMVKRHDEKLTMYGVAKMPRVNPGTVLNNPQLDSVMSAEERQRFTNLSTEELWSLEHKFDAFIDECFGQNKFKIKAEMISLVLLNWDLNSQDLLNINKVKLRDRPDLLPAFMKEAGLFYGEPGTLGKKIPTPPDYLNILRHCPVYELGGRVDFQAAARFCADMLPSE